METIFEKIIKRTIPAKIIYEDDKVISFLDIAPVSRGHCLVVPKKPYKDIYEIDEDTLKHLIGVVKVLSTKLKKILKCDGINLLNNNEAPAGQIIFHYHMHIVPRYANDNIKYNLPHQEVTDKELNEVYNIIKKSL